MGRAVFIFYLNLLRLSTGYAVKALRSINSPEAKHLSLISHINNTIWNRFAHFMHVIQAKIYICGSFTSSDRGFVAVLKYDNLLLLLTLCCHFQISIQPILYDKVAERDTDVTKTGRCTETCQLTIFTRRSSRHSGVVYGIVGCNLLGNQGHYCIIRHLKNRHTFCSNDVADKSHSYRFCIFNVCKFLTQAIRKPIDHFVGVIFYISLHLFRFHADKLNILLPVCAQLSPHMHMMTDRGEGEFKSIVQACVRRDVPQSLFNKTFPLGSVSVYVFGSVCMKVLRVQQRLYVPV